MIQGDKEFDNHLKTLWDMIAQQLNTVKTLLVGKSGTFEDFDKLPGIPKSIPTN
jgi:hypothetical protein